MKTDHLNILLIDDESIVRQTLSGFLEALGHHPQDVSDGHVAIEHLEKTVYDLIITDLRMPQLSGYDLLNWLKENQRKEQVIIITGHGDNTIRRKVIALGAQALLTKPVGLEELEEAINHIFLST